MVDGIPKQTGNSRYLKSAIPSNISFTDFIELLRSGNFPIDWNGTNIAGWDRLPTQLNAETLLSNEAGIFIDPDDPPKTPTEAFIKLKELVGEGAGLRPQLLVHVETGAAITATDGITTLRATGTGDFVTISLPNYGTWSVSAVIGGNTTNIERVVVDQIRQFKIYLSFFEATLVVTAEPDAIITVTNTVQNLVETAGHDGTAEFTIRFAGVQTISATLDGISSSTVTRSVIAQGQHTATVLFARIHVSVESGATVTAVQGGTTLTQASDGEVVFLLPSIGIWTVTATYLGEVDIRQVNVTEHQSYFIVLSVMGYVFGVEWDYSNPSTSLRRLTVENDPDGYVTVNITSLPAPAVGTSLGSSPFDEFYPWSDMDEFNVSGNTVTYRKGHPQFSRTLNDTVVRIPRYWYRVVQDEATTRIRYYISSRQRSGFSVHPAFSRGDGVERDYVYIGKYFTRNDGAVVSYTTSGTNAPSQTYDGESMFFALMFASQKGARWWMWDAAMWSAISLLYLVEFASWDIRSIIGTGYQVTAPTSGAVQRNGRTDAMVYHTGREDASIMQSAAQYRGIENLWGAANQYLGGVIASSNAPTAPGTARVRITLQPELMATGNNLDTGLDVGTAGVGTYANRADVPTLHPWLIFPHVVGVGAAQNTYTASQIRTSSGIGENTRLVVHNGLWSHFDAGAIGVTALRLMFLP